MPTPALFTRLSGADEGQQVGVHHLGVRGEQAVRKRFNNARCECCYAVPMLLAKRGAAPFFWGIRVACRWSPLCVTLRAFGETDGLELHDMERPRTAVTE